MLFHCLDDSLFTDLLPYLIRRRINVSCVSANLQQFAYSILSHSRQVADLIEMNMKKTDGSFTMANAYTYLRAESAMSVRYMFGSVTPFQAEYEKNGVTGRMKFKSTIYQGY